MSARRSLPLVVAAGLLASAACSRAAEEAQPILAGAPMDLSLTVYRAPSRESGSMSLENLQGFALVRETRMVQLPAGLSRVRFEGVADGIEPVSAILTGLSEGVLEKNLDAQLLSPATLLAAAAGRPVILVRSNRRTGKIERLPASILTGPDADGVVSISIAGRHLDRLAVSAGQFFLWRFLTRDGWWRAHPFSLSAEPDGRRLRITVEAVGDYTSLLQHVRPGTRMMAEGPYGTLTATRRTQPKVLLIAGGVGITPLRALLGELSRESADVVLLYRASDWNRVLLKDELDELGASRRVTIRYLVGRRGSAELPQDPFTPRALRRAVPDALTRDVYVCGPDGMMAVVRDGLHKLGVPDARIHFERFAY